MCHGESMMTHSSGISAPKRAEWYMDPVRTELHRGYKIVIYTWPQTSDDGRVGMYAIYRVDNNERVKGGFVLTHNPEGTALEDAKHWIDDQRS